MTPDEVQKVNMTNEEIVKEFTDKFVEDAPGIALWVDTETGSKSSEYGALDGLKEWILEQLEAKDAEWQSHFNEMEAKWRKELESVNERCEKELKIADDRWKRNEKHRTQRDDLVLEHSLEIEEINAEWKKRIENAKPKEDEYYYDEENEEHNNTEADLLSCCESMGEAHALGFNTGVDEFINNLKL
ncbi:hypothetical protein LCGC14_0918270 [marine sediment metagenome]|uniref:Uncharacterized protein n=1 Tax=marine sediment metagenome TaxID=412755 RepID=A0A0F9NRP3_9ZZZZ|nr:hypothetical protein [bacterium]